MTDDPLARDLRDAIAARRPPPPRQLAARLTAAAAGPPRPRILAPALLAGIVAIGALVVLATRPSERSQTVASVPMPTIVAAAGGGDVAAPAGTPPDLAAYDAVLDETSAVPVSAAQRARIRSIAEVLARDRATHRERKRTAEIDLRAELGHGAIDTVRAAAAYDRVAAEDAALGRSELIARLDVRAVLEPQQRATVEGVRPPAPRPSPPATASAELTVTSAVPGSVLVDGKAVGTTPVHVTIAAGKHRLRVEHAGYDATEKIFEIGAGSKISLSADPPGVAASGTTGTLLVTANPWGVITIDGKRIGETPLKVKLAPGRHKVNLVRDEPDAHVSRTAEVTIQAGQTTNLSLSLTGE